MRSGHTKGSTRSLHKIAHAGNHVIGKDGATAASVARAALQAAELLPIEEISKGI